MLTKSYAATFKAAKDATGAPTGEVEAVVSVYGNVDLMGDRVVKGAFADTLAEWKSAGDPIPMVWSHDWANPMSHIGSWDAASATETDQGLLLKGNIDVGVGNPVADQVARLLADRRVKEFSFAYDVQDEKPASDGANELLKLGLIEAGPTLKGANPETELVMAKALAEAAAKSGRVLSAKNEEAIRSCVETLRGVLSSLDSGKAAKHEEPEPITTPKAEEAAECDSCGAPVDGDGKYQAAEEKTSEETDDLETLEDEAYAEKARREEVALKDALLRATIEAL